MSKSGEFLILDAEPGRFALYGWMNITLAVWTARVQIDVLDRLARASDEHCSAYPKGVSNIHLVQQDIGLPDSRTRKRLVEISRTATPHLATVCAVVGGQGFWASRMRSLITGVRMMVPGPFEFRLVGSPDEIVAWLPQAHERRTGMRVDPEELRMWIARCDTRGLSASSLLRAGSSSGIAALRADPDATVEMPVQAATTLPSPSRVAADATQAVDAPVSAPPSAAASG